MVITGASGFLGGALLRTLSGAGYVCLGVSRQGGPGLLAVTSYAETPPGDVLIHLAEINDRARANQAGAAYEQEAAKTLALLLAKGYAKVIYASSAVLYGDGFRAARLESEPVTATDTYTRVKLAAEGAVLARGGLVARLANLYGPGMAQGNVLGDMLRQLPQEGPLTLRDVSPVRDFLWIGDAVAAMQAMVSAPAGGIFNTGSGRGVSIRELATMLLEVTGQSGRELISQCQDALPSSLVLDIAKSQARLGWRPVVGLREGLRLLVNAQ